MLHPVPHRLRRLLAAIFLAFSAIALPATTRAAAIVVNSTSQEQPFVTNGNCTLAEAIQAANTDSAIDGCMAGSGPDVIMLGANATYTLMTSAAVADGAVGLPVINSTISLQGNNATIQRMGDTPFRLISVASNGALSLQSVTLAGGMVSRPGGGIMNAGWLHLDAVHVQDNHALSGGAIASQGTLRIENSFIQNNSLIVSTSFSEGGGLYIGKGNAQISQSIISDNSAVGERTLQVGALMNYTGTVSITDSLIANNRASEVGAILNGGTMLIANSTISGNQASSRMAAIGNAGRLTITNSAVYSNTTQGNLGAIFSDNTLVITNTTISGNSGGAFGGIASFGTLRIAHSTVAHNQAIPVAGNTSSGGLLNNGVVTSTHTIIAGNTLRDGTPSDCAGSIHSQGYNLIQEFAGCTLVSGVGDLTGLDPQLGPLADNGGPTWSHLLLPDSPAINAGAPQYAGLLMSDQRGPAFPRVVDGRIDIGAIEASSSVMTATATSEPSQTADTATTAPPTVEPSQSPTATTAPPTRTIQATPLICVHHCVFIPIVPRPSRST